MVGKQVNAELQQNVGYVDEHPVLDQQIAFASPPVAHAHEQTLPIRRLPKEGFRQHSVE